MKQCDMKWIPLVALCTLAWLESQLTVAMRIWYSLVEGTRSFQYSPWAVDVTLCLLKVR